MIFENFSKYKLTPLFKKSSPCSVHGSLLFLEEKWRYKLVENFIL